MPGRARARGDGGRAVRTTVRTEGRGGAPEEDDGPGTAVRGPGAGGVDALIRWVRPAPGRTGIPRGTGRPPIL